MSKIWRETSTDQFYGSGWKGGPGNLHRQYEFLGYLKWSRGWRSAQRTALCDKEISSMSTGSPRQGWKRKWKSGWWERSLTHLWAAREKAWVSQGIVSFPISQVWKLSKLESVRDAVQRRGSCTINSDIRVRISTKEQISNIAGDIWLRLTLAIRWSHSSSVMNPFNKNALGFHDNCWISPLQSSCCPTNSSLRILSQPGIERGFTSQNNTPLH